MEKRKTCQRCERPTPRGCICEGIPEERIALHRTSVLVLQHPDELRHKNRSLPLLELSLVQTDLKVIIRRRLGDQVDKDIIATLQDDTHPLILMYPGKDAMTLKEGMDLVQDKYPSSCKINLLVLDATWKYAREMDQANERDKRYPSHMIRVALSTNDFPASFAPRRFAIRAPPSIDHLSTAETIAFVLSKLENNPNLYDTLMKPLDAMVRKWLAFTYKETQKKSNDGDDPSSNEKEKKPISRKRKHI